MTDMPARLGQMRLRDLRLLELVHQHRSLGRIAQHLHLTQPAITQALRALEQAFGVQLVLRESRGVSLTPAGAAALAHLRAMAQEARLAYVAATQPDRPLVRLGCSPMASLGVVPRALARLRRLAPQVRVQVEEASVPALWQMLDAGTVDALVARRPDLAAGERNPPGIRVEVVGRERMVVVAPRAHAVARKPTLEALAACTWVLPSPGSMVTRAFEAWFGREGLALPEVAYTSASFMTNLRLAADCGLLTIAPESAVVAQRAALKLKAIEVDWDTGVSEIVLATRTTRGDDPVLVRVRSCFEAA